MLIRICFVQHRFCIHILIIHHIWLEVLTYNMSAYCDFSVCSIYTKYILYTIHIYIYIIYIYIISIYIYNCVCVSLYSIRRIVTRRHPPSVSSWEAFPGSTWSAPTTWCDFTSAWDFEKRSLDWILRNQPCTDDFPNISSSGTSQRLPSWILGVYTLMSQ